MREYKDYELEICKALQHDIIELGGTEWDIDTIYNMWSEWSEMCAAGFLGYIEGDLGLLSNVINILYGKHYRIK